MAGEKGEGVRTGTRARELGEGARRGTARDREVRTILERVGRLSDLVGIKPPRGHDGAQRRQHYLDAQAMLKDTVYLQGLGRVQPVKIGRRMQLERAAESTQVLKSTRQPCALVSTHQD
eukprot:CAMPEP_0174710040 /NCGR_PEP_ID=MMETSP1094-20130205/11792_1 /TAXON_ID=156173 /ORGANISM="Chrysochromulina brevifilum, Strain UTEX LB 985" /LENGTH=118 /DNA_ID=CAMNT_0015908781 /DNA_START=566 /DNA_END=924 /DNA_ORIENTATION=-